MTEERWRQIERLYDAALERPPGERTQFLAAVCEADRELFDQVNGLLSEERRAGSFMEGRAIDRLAREYASGVSQPRPDMPGPDLVGQRLSHYEILEKVGMGGMGVVYKGRDIRLGRFVAIKVLPGNATSDPVRVGRFTLEARAASALSHPNIVGIYEVDHAEGVHFIAMEFVPGHTLKELIQAEGGLPVDRALAYAVQIADALCCAHDAGIVHRDLKPANVLVDAHDRVRILDFGLAKLTEPDKTGDVAGREGVCERSESGLVLGTAGYMSPEQAEGKAVDVRSDVFSFGALLYEMTTGRRAFAGSSPAATIAAVLDREPTPASELRPEIPVEVDDAIRLCLRKDPGERPANLFDIRTVLEEIRQGVRSFPRVESAPRGFFRLRRIVFAAIAMLGMAAVVVFVYMWEGVSPLPPSINVLPLATLPGSVGSPSLSPDGRYLAFSWGGEAGENLDIYVMETAKPGTTRRVTEDAGPDLSPSWSPDGAQIAFCRGAGRKGHVFLVSPLGGPERRLTHYDYACVSWMPDGKTLAVPQRDREDEDPSIFLVSVSDGVRRKLYHPPSAPAWNYVCWFSVSPDGRLVAFRTRGNSVRLSLAILPLKGERAAGEPHLVEAAEERMVSGAWMPDSRHFVFPSDRGGRRALWQVRADTKGGNAERLAGTDDADSVSVSTANPPRLAYKRYITDTDIWSLRIGDDGRAREAPVSVTRRKSREYAGQLSPDGGKIAFESDYGMTFGTFGAQLWVANIDGSSPVRISGPGGGTPRWSPDGRRLAFNYVSDGNIDIWLVNSDGSGLRRLTSEPSIDSRASWSRDGRWIYFRSNRSGAERIWKMPAEGGAAQQVTRVDGQEGFEGSDGRLYFFRNTKTRTSGNALEGSLWSVHAGGGQETPVLPHVWTLAWAMSKRGIFFMEFGGGRQANDPVPLRFLDLTLRQVVEVGAIGGKTVPEVALSATDDGRLVAWTEVGEQRSDLVLIEYPR